MLHSHTVRFCIRLSVCRLFSSKRVFTFRVKTETKKLVWIKGELKATVAYNNCPSGFEIKFEILVGLREPDEKYFK